METKKRLTTNHNCQACGQIVSSRQFHPIECCESFKAGIKEVVEWMQLYVIAHGRVDFGSDEWQAQLKEWGVTLDK